LFLQFGPNSFIHSFIHFEHFYSTLSRRLLRSAPDSSTTKKEKGYHLLGGDNLTEQMHSQCHRTAIIGHIPKYASVFAYMCDVMHWLPVSQRILYRISALVWRSVTGCGPSYMTDLCWPVSDLAFRRALRSSAHGELLVPRARSALN